MSCILTDRIWLRYEWTHSRLRIDMRFRFHNHVFFSSVHLCSSHANLYAIHCIWLSVNFRCIREPKHSLFLHICNVDTTYGRLSPLVATIIGLSLIVVNIFNARFNYCHALNIKLTADNAHISFATIFFSSHTFSLTLYLSCSVARHLHWFIISKQTAKWFILRFACEPGNELRLRHFYRCMTRCSLMEIAYS